MNGEQKHTPGPLTYSRAKKPDNVGGWDWAIADANGNVVAECFDIVGEDQNGYTKIDAEGLARLFAGAPSTAAERDRLREVNADLLKALEGAEEWLEGWASAEPYLSVIRAAKAKGQGG